jgi:hypothetical protein
VSAPPHGPREFFPDFRDILRMQGADAVLSSETLLASAGRDELFYTPFESVNGNAQLVLVGITPGQNQLKLSYDAVRALAAAGKSDDSILHQTKAANSFGGKSMRPNLLRMMNALRFDALLGISDVAELWGVRADLLHATSVVPHAAFRRKKMFGGSFAEVLASPPMRECFEQDFVASLVRLSPGAVYVALGPTPLAALDWCVEQGHLGHRQILGAFAHPSSSSGSQVAVYLGEVQPEDLKVEDPVHRRLDFLLPAAIRLRAAIAAKLKEKTLVTPTLVPPVTRVASERTQKTVNSIVARSPRPVDRVETGLHYVVTRGAKAGVVLRPHVHDDGCLVVSPSRYEKDYVRLPSGTSPEPHLRQGLRLRMSAPGCAPSLIIPASIRGRDSS